MGDVKELEMQLAEYTASLYKERYLDDQFKMVQQLEDESHPGFVDEVVSLFFQDSERLLNEIYNLLNQQKNVDFNKLDGHVYQLKSRSSNVGAKRVQNACNHLKNFSQGQNIQGCLNCLPLLRNEYFLVKTKLQTLFQLEKQVLASGGSIPNPKD